MAEIEEKDMLTPELKEKMKNKSIFIIVIFCAITLIAVGVFLSGDNNASKNGWEKIK